MESGAYTSGGDQYPLQFSVEYPDRDLNRLTTAFRIIVGIPILIVLGAIGGAEWSSWSNGNGGKGAAFAAGGGGGFFFPPVLVIVFWEKYPRSGYDTKPQLFRFSNRNFAF